MDRRTDIKAMFPVDKPSEGVYVGKMGTGGIPEQLRMREVGIHVGAVASEGCSLPAFCKGRWRSIGFAVTVAPLVLLY